MANDREQTAEQVRKDGNTKRKRKQDADAETEGSVPSKKRQRQEERREARQQKKGKKPKQDDGDDAAGAEVVVTEVLEQAKSSDKVRLKEEKKMSKKAKEESTAPTTAKATKIGKRKNDSNDDNGEAVPANLNANRIPVNAKHWVAGEEHGEASKTKSNGEDTKKDKSQRFIAFIGNLPYTATSDSITKHFSGIAPFHVRAPTDPSTGKSKGYAFLEFEGYDKMKSCLKLYHHSNFGEGKKARKINVELTAGGGGNTEARKMKIKEKNEKLKEERKKAHEDESKGRQGGKRPAPVQTDGAEDEDTEQNADIHPSRRKRMGL